MSVDISSGIWTFCVVDEQPKSVDFECFALSKTDLRKVARYRFIYLINSSLYIIFSNIYKTVSSMEQVLIIVLKSLVQNLNQ